MADEAKARGYSAFSSGNFSEAISQFTEAINISPNNHILYSNRSAAYASLSNFSQALSDAQKTVELKPDWSKGYSRLGTAYTGLYNYSDAVSSYEKGLEIDPTNNVLKSGLTDAKLSLETTNLSHKRKELKIAFNATKSAKELLEIFDEMETCFDEKVLASDCVTLVHTLVQQNRHEDACIFVKKAGKILSDKCCGENPCSLDDNFNFLFAKVCNVIGSNCLDSNYYDGSLQNLNLANMILTKFENDETSVCDGKCVLRALAFNEYLRHRVKMFTGKVIESAIHANKCLEVKEKFMDEGCHELALANMDVFFAYGSATMFEDSLPYGWKALEIHKKNLGSDHLEVAKMRNSLAFIYRQLGDYDKAREQDELAKAVLEIRGSPEDMIRAGRYEEAIRVLESNVSRAGLKEDSRALDFISMANAYFKLEKFPDAKKQLGSAQEILEKRPGMFNQKNIFAMILFEISGLYEKMSDTEASVALLKRVLAIPDLPQNLFQRAALRFLSLVSESGKAKERIPDMLDLVAKMKVIFGPEHSDVGYGYGHLGVAYWNSGQQELAVKFSEDAKSTLDAAIGPNHINSLKASHSLSEYYGKIGRYALALEIGKRVVEGLKGLPPSELGFMHEVNTHLSKMKERLAESPTAASSQSTDGGISVKISKCDNSDDGNGTS